MATILIVEDRPTDRQFLATLLGYRGHRVLEASDAVDALDNARQNRPELIISDVLMPSVDGYEFVRRLRQIDGVGQTPVIFYTATYHEREARALARQCGVLDILTKPSEPEAILATVDAVLSRRSRAATIATPDVEPFDREHARLVNQKLSETVHELEATQQRVAAVVDVAHQIAAEHRPSFLLKTVCSEARQVTFAQHAVLGLLSEDGSNVQALISSGLTDDMEVGINRPAVRGALLSAIAERRTLRTRNPDGRPEALGLPDRGLSIFSFLAVPIASHTRIYGWIGLYNKLGADEFSPADEEVATVLATHAAIAYENARLIDDLHRHTTALQRSEERTQYALGAARMGVWELDLASDRVTWSDTMALVFGLTPEQAPSTSEAFFALIHPDDRRMVEESVERAAREGTDYQVEFRALCPDGTPRWVAGQARMLRDADDKPVRLLGVGMDISDRKSLEAQFRQAQKMEAVGQLAGGVAHDFNNLLTAILGYSNFVVETLEPGDPRRSDIGEIVKAAERAAALTKQLLAFSRKQVLQPTTVDLNALVTGLRQMLGRLIGEHIDLITTLDPDLGVVRADPGQLEQVLMNLVVNARDAMPSGGRLTVETANVELDQSYAMRHAPVLPGSYVMLAVSDSGIGMNEDTKRHLFEPFFTTKERGQGTGLGLATVYGIVKQSGGYIWVYSEPGHGATFKVYMPRTDQTEEIKADLAAEDAMAVGTETVLVVEDEEAVRFLTRVILERSGYRVFDAPNPQQAEALFEQNVGLFDLVVTDVIMPGSTGPKLFERLARRRPDLKVLYVSGYTDDAIVHQGQLDPGVDFLQKPFTADALNRKVRQVLDR